MSSPAETAAPDAEQGTTRTRGYAGVESETLQPLQAGLGSTLARSTEPLSDSDEAQKPHPCCLS